MIFGRRKNRTAEQADAVDEVGRDAAVGEDEGAEAEDGDETPVDPDPDAAPEEIDGSELDVDDLDGQDWRSAGPYDVSEVDLEEDPPEGLPRIDLGSIVVTGFPGAELRLQVDEASQAIVSAMLVLEDSALEIGAYAAPRTGGYWPELREDLIAATTEAGGTTQLAEGPFGVELRRIIPVTTPTGEEGYQPSRMWVVEGPRWLLRGIVYGQAALAEGVEAPVAQFLTAFRSVVVRRGDQAMGPGDLLALKLPEELVPDNTDGTE